VAQEYLLRSKAADRPSRFDVVVVTPGPDPRVEVIKHAFWCE
jgi:Holliday junction resolvase-like predicted endonuclease